MLSSLRERVTKKWDSLDKYGQFDCVLVGAALIAMAFIALELGLHALGVQ